MICKRSLTALVVSVLIGASAGGVAASPPRCLGRRATIVGRDSDRQPDEIRGTRGADVIVARAGDDSIDGRGGDDLICGGEGFDLIRGGRGTDRIEGGRGSDTLHGGPGRDRLRAGPGAVEGLFGGAGRDRIAGGPGSFDGMIGGAGDDVMDGGPGLDTAELWDSPAPIDARLEADLVTGHGNDTILRTEGIVGSSFDDRLAGDDGSNLLRGGPGDDTIEAHGSGMFAEGTADLLDGGAGDDVLDGGEGDDVVGFEDSPASIVIDLAAGSATGDGTDSLSSIEAAIGSTFDDDLRGDGGDNRFVGGPGDDAIDGRGGIDEAAYFDARAPVSVDLMAGTAVGWGSDTLSSIENVTGSAGADTLRGDNRPNVIAGGSGADSIAGHGGDDVLLGGPGADEIDGGAGMDICDGETEADCELDEVE